MTMNAILRKRVVAVAVFAMAGFAAASAWSAASLQFNRPEDAVKYRQGALFVLGQHFSRIGAMANGRIPYDGKAAAEHAEVIAALAKLPMEGFGAGLDKSSSRAKPEVWSEAARFKDHNDRFVVEAAKLVAAAKTGNVDALKAAYSATANTCKSCHDAYRNH
jgi:cytochrome c556